MLSGLRSEILDLASAPEARLGSVLEQTLQRLAGGGPDAAGILVFDHSEMRTALVAAAGEGDVATPPDLFFRRALESAERRLAQVLAGGRPHLERYPPADGRPAGAALSRRCRTSLWLPLVEHRRAVALVVLESERPDAFPDGEVQEREAAARDAQPGVQRALLRHWLLKTGAPADIVGQSPAFLELERQIRLAGSSTDGAVLLTGERGSGKELVAWAIHAWSRRRSGPFVPFLGAACSESLTTDELFGHERQAFTGAGQARLGKFQAADGGTLLLDEAGDLPPAMQASFLRVLERGEVQRIGRDQTLRVNVRVVAATNRDLSALMAQGRFRHDLFDRLSFFEIRVPPLRERLEDVPLLAHYFLRTACPQTWRSSVLAHEGLCASCSGLRCTCCATDELFIALRGYSWPGNVRELRQVMTRLVATVPDEILELRHLPDAVRGAFQPAEPAEGSWRLDGVVRRHIEKTLQHTGWNQSEAARLLGLPLSTMRSKMKLLGIEPRRRA